ncbi:MAG: signal peptide-domain containing protein [Planctomycetales bacterium]|nr:signal peptide-domain containing protein [Planctomycetales bacterium]
MYHFPKLFLPLAVLAAATCSLSADEPNKSTESADKSTESADKQSIVVHLSHFTDDLHRCFMALKTANMLAGTQVEVTLYLDLEGVRLAERRQDLEVTWGTSDKTLGVIYEEFTAKGGKAKLCPHCAEGAQLGPISLRRFAQIATEDELRAMWLGASKVIDY